MSKFLVVGVLVCFFQTSALSQNHCECQSSAISALVRDAMHCVSDDCPDYFSKKILRKEKITRISVWTGSNTGLDSVSNDKNQYRIYRFLFDEGILIESTHFSKKEFDDGSSIGIPEEYKKYVIISDTLGTYYSTWAMLNYEERYSTFLTDYSIDDFLSKVDLSNASILDYKKDRKGKTLSIRQRFEVEDTLTLEERTYYNFSYDKEGRLNKVNGQISLIPYGMDSVQKVAMEIRYDKKSRTFSDYDVESKPSVLLNQRQMDKNGRLQKWVSFNGLGEVTDSTLYAYSRKGSVIRIESHFSVPYESDCGDTKWASAEFIYLPNGLLKYVNSATENGSCRYIFTYDKAK